tara:strand:+ start:310 stop:603 length:294 start_codon:yes stop_codon:yes gene_type:complete
MLMELLVLAAAFGQVFFLGLNSKLLRDDKILAGFVLSWLITVTQFAFIWAVAHAGLSPATFILWAGIGGSIGITTSQYFYKWYDCKMQSRKENNHEA